MESPTFVPVAQSSRKVRVTFTHFMGANALVVPPESYVITRISDGTTIAVSELFRVGDTGTRIELALDSELVPFVDYSLAIDPSVLTADGEPLFPREVLLRWRALVPRPIRIPIAVFSGEVSGGLLGSPAGQVFVSPAFDSPGANSRIEIETISVCTKAYDTYELPPDPQLAEPTFLGPGAAELPLILWGPAHRFGRPAMALADLREDVVPAPEDGPTEGLLVEPIDITRASFLNDGRWRLFPGTGASLGVFRTADNSTPIGPGPTTGPFTIA